MIRETMVPYNYKQEKRRATNCPEYLRMTSPNDKVPLRFLKVAFLVLILAPWPLLIVSAVLLRMKHYFALGVISGGAVMLCSIFTVVLFTLRQEAKEKREAGEAAMVKMESEPPWWDAFEQQFYQLGRAHVWTTVT